MKARTIQPSLKVAVIQEASFWGICCMARKLAKDMEKPRARAVRPHMSAVARRESRKDCQVNSW